MAKGRIEKGDIVAEGILKDFNKDLKTATDNVNLLTTALKAVQETGKALKKGVSTVKPKDVKTIQEFNALTNQSNANAKNRLQIDKSLLTAKEKLKQAQSAQNKAIKVEVALGDKQINTLEKLRARNQAIKIAKDKVNFSTKKGQEAIKKLNAELDKNNKVLQKNASALGKQKMNIGNYKSAISGLRSGLAQLGLSMGVFQILKNSFNVVKDFEQGQANLAAVLGISTDQMGALTEQAKELGATTTFTATQVSELQKEYAKLGFSMSEIEDVTEATLLLAEATGTDLGRAAEVTGATIRGFGLSAKDTQRVVDVMAKSFSSSSLDMEKFATGMSAVAPVAKNMGFSIEETTALLGTLTDRGIDASSAGTGLRNMFLDSTKAGITLEEALAEINGASDKTAKAFDLFGKRGATLGVILAENGTAVDSLTGKLLDSDDAAKDMADTQRNTLGGAIKLLTSAWEGWILKMNEGVGAGAFLGRTIKFLADNFETIIKWIGKAVTVLVGFKIAMKAIKFSESIGGLKGIGDAFKSIGKGAKGATEGATNMGKALKGIGFGLALTMALEFAKSLYDVASGAAETRRQVDLLASANKKGAEVTNDIIEKADREIERKKKLLEIEKAKGLLKPLEFERELKKLEEGKLKRLEDARKVREDEISQLTTEQHLIRKRIALAKKEGEIDIRTGELMNQDEIDELNKELQKNIDKTTLKSRTERALANAMTTTEDAIHDYSVTLADNSSILDRSTHSVDDRIKKEVELLSVLKRKKEAEITDVGRIEVGDVADTNREKLERNSLEAEYNVLIADVNQTEEERINLLTRQIIARAELEKYGKTEAEQQVINARMLKSINELTAKEVASTENLSKLRNDAIDLTTQYFIEQADKRIAKIEEEIDAATKQADHYRTLAENGNITAKESLAEQNRLIAEANIQKEKEEKRKQRILMVSSVLQAFNSNLEAGDNSGEAFTKAITSTELIKQFIGALPTFLEGVEDTGTNGSGIDGKGGFHAVLHPNERVLTKEQNAKIGGVSNDYVAQVMEQHRVGNYMDGSLLIAKIDNAELINGLSNLENKMSAVEKAILNQPRESNNTAEMLSNYMMFENVKTQGGKTTTSRFKVRK